jgi:hypothetical protein
MTAARTAIQDFSTANPIYANAIVTAYTVEAGVKTSTKATLYSSISATGSLANPQTLDAFGKFRQPVYINDAVILTVTGIGNTPDHDTGIVSAGRRVDVVISSAEILALHTTPKTLIAAPGAGKALVQERSVFFLDYHSAAYAAIAAGDDLTIRYTDGSGATVGTLETTGFLDQTADTYALLIPAAGSLILPANAPLVASLAGAVTTGNSPVATRLSYNVVDLSTLLTA